MTITRFTARFFIVLIFCLNSAYGKGWDVEIWQYLNWTNFEKGPYLLYTQGETRLDRDFKSLYYYRLSECFAYQALSYLTLETHYSYVSVKPRGATQFVSRHRLEFEINPALTLENHLKISWRNRFEVIKKQAISKLQYVFRHRVKLSYPIENCGKLVGIGCSDEVIYDLQTHYITQNRFIPFFLDFALSKRTALEVFMMVRNLYSLSDDIWYRSIVLGSTVSF